MDERIARLEKDNRDIHDRLDRLADQLEQIRELAFEARERVYEALEVVQDLLKLQTPEPEETPDVQDLR